MKEQFEQMSLEDLAKVLHEGLYILYTKLVKIKGFGNISAVVGTLNASHQDDIYIINTSGVDDIDKAEVFKI